MTTVSPLRTLAADPGISPTVQSIVDQILERIHDGDLRPGTAVRDVEIARELGLSRTPVREAFQVLRDAGVLEVSASRYTRIATLSPEQTEYARRAWMPLQRAALDEILSGPEVDPSSIALLEELHAESHAAAVRLDNPHLASANARFFGVTVELTGNPYLAKAVGAVVHALRLGLLSLPEQLDLGQVVQAQRETIDAITRRDPAMVDKAMATLEAISIPHTRA